MTFAPKALAEVHRLSGGIPRLINLICDRALLSGYSMRTNRITPEMAVHAAKSLDVQRPSAPRRWGRLRASLLAGAAVALLASAMAVGTTTMLYQRLAAGALAANASASQGGRGPADPSGAARVPAPQADVRPVSAEPASPSAERVDRQLPAGAALTILMGSYPVSGSEELRAASSTAIRSVTDWLEASGFHVYYAEVDLGERGRWQRILAGAYTDPDLARADATRLKSTATGAEARVVAAGAATGLSQPVREAEVSARRSGIEP